MNNWNCKNSPGVFREINCTIDSNKKYIDNVDEALFNSGMPVGRYCTFDFIETICNHINFDDVNVILDVGSRDCLQSIEFKRWLPHSKVYAFEANPEQITLCESNASKAEGIFVVPKAANTYTGKTDFFVVYTGNVGASSLLEINNHSRSRDWKQNKVEIDCVRIDEWCVENNVDSIDLLWMDVQGAELNVLETVKAICTEVEIAHMYHNSTLKENLDEYLEQRGFVELQTWALGKSTDLNHLKNTNGEVDVVYINKKYLK